MAEGNVNDPWWIYNDPAYGIGGGGDIPPSPGPGFVWDPGQGKWVDPKFAYGSNGSNNDGNGPGGSPVERMALISRKQWEDYLARFAPLENKLIASKTTFDPKNSVAEAAQNVENSFNTAFGTRERNASRYGLDQSPEVKAALHNQALLDKSAAMVDAKNRTRMALDEYRMTY